jgi:leucyl-tRNA synthetase
MGLVQGAEPMLRLFNQGVILGPDGNRMSKSRGNVVAPDEQVEKHGTDAFRCQLMFIGPWDQGGPYNPTGMAGIVRWLNRIWSLATDHVTLARLASAPATRDLRRLAHKTIRDVTEDIEGFRFNTLIARLMEFATAMQKARDAGPVDGAAWGEAMTTLLLLAAPLAPHITEELWALRGGPYSIHQQPWPAFDADLARDDEVEIVVQVNGKVRDRLVLAASAGEAEARAAAFGSARLSEWLDGKEPRRVIYVPGKLLNIVV